MNPLSAISPAGRGRPLPSPSAYVMTAPCEKPPSTVRSEAMPGSGCERVEPFGGERERLGEGRRVRVADLVDRVPVGAAGRQVERAARRHARAAGARGRAGRGAGTGRARRRRDRGRARAAPRDPRRRARRDGAGSPRARPAGRYLRRLRSLTSRSSSAWSQPFMKSACGREPARRDLRAAGTGG